MATATIKKPKIRKYRLLASIHAGPGPAGQQVIYRKGAIIESAENLCETYVNKFELYRGENVDDDGNSRGEDVTELVRGASEAGLVVFKSGIRYNVFDEGNLDVPLNTEEITSRVEVVAFIKEYVPAATAAPAKKTRK
jgi:hypothetical protein